MLSDEYKAVSVLIEITIEPRSPMPDVAIVFDRRR